MHRNLLCRHAAQRNAERRSRRIFQDGRTQRHIRAGQNNRHDRALLGPKTAKTGTLQAPVGRYHIYDRIVSTIRSRMLSSFGILSELFSIFLCGRAFAPASEPF